jgi:hypothetical protein
LDGQVGILPNEDKSFFHFKEAVRVSLKLCSTDVGWSIASAMQLRIRIEEPALEAAAKAKNSWSNACRRLKPTQVSE